MTNQITSRDQPTQLYLFREKFLKTAEKKQMKDREYYQVKPTNITNSRQPPHLDPVILLRKYEGCQHQLYQTV